MGTSNGLLQVRRGSALVGMVEGGHGFQLGNQDSGEAISGLYGIRPDG